MRILAMAVLLAASVAPLGAQPVLRMLGFVPPTSPTAALSVQLRYDLTSPVATPATVTFFRQGGPSTTVNGVVPGTGPFLVNLPLPTNVDGVATTFTGVAQQNPGGLALGDRPLTIVVDTLGPGSLTLVSPAFPLVTPGPDVVVRGIVRKADGTPEAGGRVEARRQDPPFAGVLIGGAQVLGDGTFTAVLGIGSFPLNVPVDVTFSVFDPAGNPGAPRAAALTRQSGAGAVAVGGLALTPPAGTITNQPGVVVRGNVTGLAPLRVTFLVDGLVESTLEGLASGTSFAHSIVMPGEGPHTFTVRASNGAGGAVGPLTAGTVTLDRTPPAAPIVLTPPPDRPFVTNQDRFTITGIASGLTTPGGPPGKVLLRSVAGVRFTPAQPQVVAANGTFSTVVDVAALPDGTYTIEILSQDAAGNFSGAAGALRLRADSRARPGRVASPTELALRLKAAARAGTGAFGLAPDELAAAIDALRARAFATLHGR